MKSSYEKYRQSLEWEKVEKLINNLEKNQDIEIKTSPDYVIGYLVKFIVENKKDIDLRTKVIISANRALWAAITKNLRSITIDYNKEKLTLRAYFDQGATVDDKEAINIALTEMTADLWQEINELKYEPVDLYYPEKMTKLKEWIFIRKENLG